MPARSLNYFTGLPLLHEMSRVVGKLAAPLNYFNFLPLCTSLARGRLIQQAFLLGEGPSVVCT